MNVETMHTISGDDIEVTILGNGHVINIIGIYANFTSTDDAVLNLGSSTDSSNILIIDGDNINNYVKTVIRAYSGTINMYDGVTIQNLTRVYDGTMAVAVGINGNGTFNMYGGLITNCDSGQTNFSYGAAVNVMIGTFNMYGGAITNCISIRGGAIYGGSVANDDRDTIINIQGGTISNNEAEYGGAIFSYSTNTILIIGEDAVITNNYASNTGGAIYVGSSLTIDGAKFENNEANSVGGAIYIVSNTNSTIKNSEFINNYATYSGAVFVNSNATLNLSNSTFEYNKAALGGAICVNTYGILNIDNSIFSYNEATVAGGALFADTNTYLTVNNSTISYNKSDMGGGLYFNPAQYYDENSNEYVDGQNTIMYEASEIKFGENVVFVNNTNFDGTENNNVFIPFDPVANNSVSIIIYEDMKDSIIGITLESMTDETIDSDIFTFGYETNGNVSASTNFFSDKEGYLARTIEGEVYLTKIYTLSYETDGGTSIDDELYASNDTVTLNITTTKEGFTLDGWTDGTTIYKLTDEFIMPEENVVLSAIWVEKEKFTVTYTDGIEDEIVFDEQIITDVESGSETPEFTGTLEREFYIFNGWSPEISDTVTKDITYTAIWIEDVFGTGTDADEENDLEVNSDDNEEINEEIVINPETSDNIENVIIISIYTLNMIFLLITLRKKQLI